MYERQLDILHQSRNWKFVSTAYVIIFIDLISEDTHQECIKQINHLSIHSTSSLCNCLLLYSQKVGFMQLSLE